MGITGLIPFLEKASCPINIRQYKGQTVAVDAYCWLHRGIFSCADKIARGEKCDAYITYCLKYVNMLISHDIKPILVFDGRYLPAKAATEKKRRQSREQNKAKAAEYLRQGRTAEARRCLRNSVDVGPEMAVAVARACRSVGADCIFAPFEADAQLAYLNKKGIATAVITEDSDLILFGCVRVIFKLDLYGTGLEVVQDRLHLAMGVPPERFSMDRFRQMCVLSGCDYLASLPGIGLAKAKKFVNTTSSPDITQALGKLPSALGMYNLSVTDEYMKDFLLADATFLYQIVYDPVKRTVVPLNDPKENSLHSELAEKIGGDSLPPDTELQLALGNLDPFKLKQIDDFVPDGPKGPWGGGIGRNGPPKRKWKSIWDKNFVPWGDSKNFHSQDSLMNVERDSTWGKEAVMGVGFFSNSDGPVRRSPRKRKHKLDSEVSEEDSSKEVLCTDKDLGVIYGSPPSKKSRIEAANSIEEEIESPDKKVSMMVMEILGEEEPANRKLKRKLFKSNAPSPEPNKTLKEKQDDCKSDVSQEKKDCEQESVVANSEEENSPSLNTDAQLAKSDICLETLEAVSSKSPSENKKDNTDLLFSSAPAKEEDCPASPIIGSRRKNNPFAKPSGSISQSPKVSGGILSSSGIFSKMAGLNKTPEGKKVVVKSRFFASSTVSPKKQNEEKDKEMEGSQSRIEEERLLLCNENNKSEEENLETIEDVVKNYSEPVIEILSPSNKKIEEGTQCSPRKIPNPFPIVGNEPKKDLAPSEEAVDDGKSFAGPRKPLFSWGSLQEKFSYSTSLKNGDSTNNHMPSSPVNESVRPKGSSGKNPFRSPPTPKPRGRGVGCRRPGLVRTLIPKTNSVTRGSDNQQSLLSRFGFHKK